MFPEITSDLTPLREPTYFILLSLSTSKKHGYAILKEVEALSQGRVRLSTGTLYGALARLLEQGVVHKTAGDGQVAPPAAEYDPADSRIRKYYELTPFGQRVLAAELQRLRALLNAAHLASDPEGV